MITFMPWWKEEKKPEKNEETKSIFESLSLGNHWHDLVEIWSVGYWWWRASPQQKSSSFIQAVWSYVYAKIAILFFLSMCGTLVSWAARHTTGCLNKISFESVLGQSHGLLHCHHLGKVSDVISWAMPTLFDFNICTWYNLKSQTILLIIVYPGLGLLKLLELSKCWD